MNIKQNVPILGQKQALVIQAMALISPALNDKLNAWCDKIGLPPNEIQNTIFRMGLIMFSITACGSGEAVTEDDAQKLIPLTDNEKKAFRTDG